MTGERKPLETFEMHPIKCEMCDLLPTREESAAVSRVHFPPNFWLLCISHSHTQHKTAPMCDDCDDATNLSASYVHNVDADKACFQKPSAKQFKALQTVQLNTVPA